MKKPLCTFLSIVLLTTLAGGTPPSRAATQPDLFDPATVRDLYFTFASPTWETDLQQLSADQYVKADLVVDGATYHDVGVRLKGNSSQRVPGHKKPFNVTLDAFVSGQKLYGYDTLNLNNGFADPTFVREVLVYNALRPYLPVPKAAYARMHANGAFFGLYGLVQQIEGTYLGEWFGDKEGVLFKADAPNMGQAGQPMPPLFGQTGQTMPPQPIQPMIPQPDRPTQPDQPGQGGGGAGFRSALAWLGESLAAYKSSYELKTASAGDGGYVKLRELTRLLDAPPSSGGVEDAALLEVVGSSLSVDSALWYLAAHNLFDNFDSYYSGHNYFLHWAAADQRFYVLSWDMNESFGVFPLPGLDLANPQVLAQVDPFMQSTDPGRPLVRRLLAVPRFKADYLAHYRALLAGVFDPALLADKVKTYQDLIRADLERDPNRLYTMADFETNVNEAVRANPAGGNAGGGQQGGRLIPGLLGLVRNRQAWLSARADLAAPDLAVGAHTLLPAVPTAGVGVALTVHLVGHDLPAGMDLYYRVDRRAPVRVTMNPDNGSATWTASLPGQVAGTDVTYFVRAALADGRAVFFPAADWTQPWSYHVVAADLPRLPTSELVLNEFMADNKTGITDPSGAHEDWLELYNRGPAPVQLGDYFLGSADDPWAYKLPAVALDPGGHYLIWCDNDLDEGADHAPFKLSKSGETVQLATRTAVADLVTFGALPADQSYARVQDGVNDWTVCTQPTPRTANACQVALPTALPTDQPSATPAVAHQSVYLPVLRNG